MQAEKEAARTFLEQGSYDFTFGDKVEAATNAHETMVQKASSAQILHLVPAKTAAAQRLAAIAAARPKHLQGGSFIHLGLGDNVVKVTRESRKISVVPQKNVRADPLTDVIVKVDYQLQ